VDGPKTRIPPSCRRGVQHAIDCGPSALDIIDDASGAHERKIGTFGKVGRYDAGTQILAVVADSYAAKASRSADFHC
jgi:hypothetical protein